MYENFLQQFKYFHEFCTRTPVVTRTTANPSQQKSELEA